MRHYAYIICTAIMATMFQSITATASIYIRRPIKQHLESADYIVIGKLETLKERQLEIVYRNHYRGRDMHVYYDTGFINVTEILKVQKRIYIQGDTRIKQIPLAVYSKNQLQPSGSRMSNSSYSGYKIASGNEGIWLLKQSSLVDYFEAPNNYFLLPIDSLKAVKNYLREIIADENRKIYPCEHDIATWSTWIEKGETQQVYAVKDSLNKLPQKDPWPEPLKIMLLNMIKWQASQTPKQETFSEDLTRLISFQADERFLPFLKDGLGINPSAGLGLYKIGEPAFDFLLQEVYSKSPLNRKYEALKNLTAMLHTYPNFLTEKEDKQALVQQALFHVIWHYPPEPKLRAVQSLSHFKDSKTRSTLDSLSHHDNYQVNGQYPIRKQALEILNFMRQ